MKHSQLDLRSAVAAAVLTFGTITASFACEDVNATPARSSDTSIPAAATVGSGAGSQDRAVSRRIAASVAACHSRYCPSWALEARWSGEEPLSW
jgi:hypothetical protein